MLSIRHGIMFHDTSKTIQYVLYIIIDYFKRTTSYLVMFIFHYLIEKLIITL